MAFLDCHCVISAELILNFLMDGVLFVVAKAFILKSTVLPRDDVPGACCTLFCNLASSTDRFFGLCEQTMVFHTKWTVP
jgi:hypothetical protein